MKSKQIVLLSLSAIVFFFYSLIPLAFADISTTQLRRIDADVGYNLHRNNFLRTNNAVIFDALVAESKPAKILVGEKQVEEGESLPIYNQVNGRQTLIVYDYPETIGKSKVASDSRRYLERQGFRIFFACKSSSFCNFSNFENFSAYFIDAVPEELSPEYILAIKGTTVISVLLGNIRGQVRAVVSRMEAATLEMDGQFSNSKGGGEKSLTIYFEPGKFLLSDTQKQQVKNWYLNNSHKNIKVSIQGFSDATGDDQAKNRIAKLRAIEIEKLIQNFDDKSKSEIVDFDSEMFFEHVLPLPSQSLRKVNIEMLDNNAVDLPAK